MYADTTDKPALKQISAVMILLHWTQRTGIWLNPTVNLFPRYSYLESVSHRFTRTPIIYFLLVVSSPTLDWPPYSVFIMSLLYHLYKKKNSRRHQNIFYMTLWRYRGVIEPPGFYRAWWYTCVNVAVGENYSFQVAYKGCWDLCQPSLVDLYSTPGPYLLLLCILPH